MVGVSGTAVKAIGFVFRNTAMRGVSFFQISQGGIALTSANTSNTTLLNAFVANLAPDVAFCEMKEPAGSAALLAALASHQTRFNTAYANTAWVYVGSTPVSTGDVDQVANNVVFSDHADAYGQSYFDGYTPIGSYANLTALGWQNDGTHPTDGCSRFLLGLMIDALGFSIFNRKDVSMEFARDRCVFGDYVDLPGGSGSSVGIASTAALIPGTNPYTVAAWVWRTGTANAAIMGSSPNGLNFNVQGTLNLQKSAAVQISGSTRLVAEGRWVFCAASRIGTTVTYYIDGVPINQVSDANDHIVAITSVGATGAGTPAAIKLREPMFFNRGLSQAEIWGLYAGGPSEKDYGVTGSTVVSGSLVVGKRYRVTGTGSITHNAVVFNVGEEFVATATTFTTASGSPTVTSIGLLFMLGPVNGNSRLWMDVSGNSRHGTLGGSVVTPPASLIRTYGTATLVAGLVTVTTPVAFSSSIIMVSRDQQNGGGIGHLRIGTKSVGSFQIASSDGTDVSSVNWEIIG
jgi:hypothetical protein